MGAGKYLHIIASIPTKDFSIFDVSLNVGTIVVVAKIDIQKDGSIGPQHNNIITILAVYRFNVAINKDVIALTSPINGSENAARLVNCHKITSSASINLSFDFAINCDVIREGASVN